MHFDRFGCLYAPFPVLLSPLGTNVELVHEGLHVALFLDCHVVGFKILGEIYLLLVYLAWRASILFL